MPRGKATKRRNTRKPRAKPNTLLPRQRLLEEFGVITLEELATLFGCDIKTLRNRAKTDLPKYSKVGGQWLFRKVDVDDYMQHRMSR